MLAVLQREVKSYFTGMTGYLICAFLLLFIGLYCAAWNFLALLPNFEYALQSMTYVFMIIIPVLTMRVIAEERRQKTDQLLYSLPLSATDIVMGKYFAMLIVLLIPLAVCSLYPLLLTLYGAVYLPTAYSAIVGFFFLGAALVSIGMFVSSVTENQSIAAVLCFVVMLLAFFMSSLSSLVPTTASSSFFALSFLSFALSIALLLLTQNGVLALLVFIVLEGGLTALLMFAPALLEGRFGQLMRALSFFDRFDIFIQGMFDVTAIVYYLAVSVIFVFLTIQSLEKRRWG